MKDFIDLLLDMKCEKIESYVQFTICFESDNSLYTLYDNILIKFPPDKIYFHLASIKFNEEANHYSYYEITDKKYNDIFKKALEDVVSKHKPKP
jgi:hypothetical protein